jgi:hypothetical protein
MAREISGLDRTGAWWCNGSTQQGGTEGGGGKAAGIRMERTHTRIYQMIRPDNGRKCINVGTCITARLGRRVAHISLGPRAVV